MNLEGETLGNFDIVAELGRGGMGTVYRGAAKRDGPSGPKGSEVALKVFHPHLVEDQRAFDRFRREAEIGKRIRHDHVVRTFDVGREEVAGQRVHYMVMEVIEGRTLKELLDELGTVPEHLIYQIADQVLDALRAIHARDIVHRDIKPENIVITPDHRVLLMDLGVARLLGKGETLSAGEFVGSISYAGPEQFAPQEGGVGPRTDLYAFGIALFELATGQNPFGTQNVATILQQKLSEEVPTPRSVRPDLDGFLNEVIVTLTRRNASERFASAGELRRILQEGEQSDWWRQRAAGTTVPSAQRALERLRLEREAPLIGRAAEQERVREHWADGGVLLVSGVSGVGKSRLLYEFLEEVASAGGPAVATGRCLGTGVRDYQPIIDALNDLLDSEERIGQLLSETPAVVPHIAAFLSGDEQPGEGAFSKDVLHASCAKLVQRVAADRPLILAIEDLHLAGAQALELFQYLSRCVAGHAVLLIGVFADDELDEGSDLMVLAQREDVRHVPLQPLDYEQTEELVRAVVHDEKTVAALTHPLHERGDGNPFIALDTIAHLRDTGVLEQRDDGTHVVGSVEDIAIPSTVRDLAGLKLAHLDDEQRETLEVAAVIGYEFDASLVADVLEETNMQLLQRLAGLERKQRLLVSSGKEAFRFDRRQLHEAVYEAITPSLRGEYHSLVADTMREEIEDEEPKGEPAYRLLHHLVLAERALEAEPFLENAVDFMAAHSHGGDVAPFLEKVASAFTVARPPKRFALAMKLWWSYEQQGRLEDQIRILGQAGELAEEMGEPGPRGRVHLGLGSSAFLSGDYERASDEAQQGLALTREAGDRQWESSALHLLGVACHRRGDFAGAARHWKEALAIRRDIGDRRGEAASLQVLGAVMQLIGEAEKELETKEAALAIYREIGDRRGEGMLLGNIAHAFVDAGRYDEALANYETAIEIAREIGAPGSEAFQNLNMGRALSFVGRIEEAKAAFERALELFRVVGNPHGELVVLVQLGPVLSSYGDYGLARMHLETAVELATRTGAKARLVWAERDLGTLLHRTGEPEAARAHFAAALAIEDELAASASRFITLNVVAVAALEDEAFDRAIELLEEAVALGTADVVDAIAARCRLARAYQGNGRREDAEREAAQARDLLDEVGAVSGRVGPEIYFTLRSLTEDEELRQGYLDRALELLESFQGAIGNDAYREHFTTRMWPNPEILEEARRAK